MSAADGFSMAVPRRLILVRHGETAGQSSVRYYGSTDVPLSGLGEEQMRRARLGAALVAPAAAPARPIAAFDEVCFGRWEGLTRDEIAARDPQQFARWQEDPERFVYPDGECRQAFHRRVAAGLQRLLARAPGETLLLVVHRGVIAVALAELLHLSDAERRALDIGLGSIHELARGPDGWQAVRVNAVEHLGGAAGR